jgi:hypothetical protein
MGKNKRGKVSGKKIWVTFTDIADLLEGECVPIEMDDGRQFDVKIVQYRSDPNGVALVRESLDENFGDDYDEDDDDEDDIEDPDDYEDDEDEEGEGDEGEDEEEE